MTKMTNVIALATAIEVLSADTQYAEVIEKLSNIKTSIEKKSASAKKPTARQNENGILIDAIMAYMNFGQRYSVADIMKLVPDVDGLSNQRVSGIMRSMREKGLVTYEVIKRKGYYSKAE